MSFFWYTDGILVVDSCNIFSFLFFRELIFVASYGGILAYHYNGETNSRLSIGSLAPLFLKSIYSSYSSMPYLSKIF